MARPNEAAPALIYKEGSDVIVDGGVLDPEAIDGAPLSLATPTGDVNGTNDAFVFASPPIMVFRNGVNETRLGTISTNTFTFDTPPETGDDIEGLV